MLQTEHLVNKIGVDTEENEPLKVHSISNVGADRVHRSPAEGGERRGGRAGAELSRTSIGGCLRVLLPRPRRLQSLG